MVAAPAADRGASPSVLIVFYALVSYWVRSARTEWAAALGRTTMNPTAQELSLALDSKPEDD
jgi:hypothetical protein